MLYLNPPYHVIEGVSLLPDHADPLQFYYQPLSPHLTLLENVRIALQRQLGTSFHFWRSETTLDQLNDRALACTGGVPQPPASTRLVPKGRSSTPAVLLVGPAHKE